jgi:hypothetical protein
MAPKLMTKISSIEAKLIYHMARLIELLKVLLCQKVIFVVESDFLFSKIRLRITS